MPIRSVSIDAVRLAGGYKASREGKGRDIATQEIIDSLPGMGIEIDYGTPATASEVGTLDFSKTTVMPPKSAAPATE